MPWLGEQSQVFESRGDDMRWSTFTVPTVTLPELAPSGGSIVEMFPSISQQMAPDDWSEARKNEVAARAIEALRRDHEIDIVVSRILSPKEFQDDIHLYAGALYGLSPAAGPAALFRHRTPIRGLYQAGQTTWPGFGVVGAGMSGVFAAEMLLRDGAR
jgi:phytoene dehydrogenase-like protein